MYIVRNTGKGESIFMKAVLIPGDGIGREIAESVRAVSAALDTGIEWQEFAAGAVRRRERRADRPRHAGCH